MMIARATSDRGEEILLLGLSRGNLERLTQGQPIRLSRETHGDGIPANWKILILFGETEEDMRTMLEAAGVVGSWTKTTVDPSLKSKPDAEDY